MELQEPTAFGIIDVIFKYRIAQNAELSMDEIWKLWQSK